MAINKIGADVGVLAAPMELRPAFGAAGADRVVKRGPALNRRRGERGRIEFENRSGGPSVIHWHGMIVPDTADGHPHQAVPSGERYAVEFTVRNRAGTYLYHPHPHRVTGRQTYYGLAGLVLVRR